jgi:hypothetical protein
MSLKMLIYGQPGIGKTTLCGSIVKCEDLGPALFIDLEGGTMPIASHTSLIDLNMSAMGAKEKFIATAKDAASSTIDVVRVKSSKEFETLLECLSPVNKTPYKTIILDSISELNSIIVMEVVKASGNVNRFQPQIKDYGEAGFKMQALIRNLRDFSGNVVICALSAADTDELTKRVTFKPAMVGKTTEVVCGLVDIIGYMSMNSENQREVYWQPTLSWYAKDRSEGSLLGQSTINPDMNSIAATLKLVKEKPDPKKAKL